MQVHRNPHTFHKDLDVGGNIILGEQGLQDRIATSYYRFDGDGDYLELSDNANQDIGTTDFTLSCRFKTDDVTASNQFLINKEAAGIGYGLEVRQDDLWIRLDDNTTDVTAKIATAVFQNDIYYHVLVRFDRSGDATAYINGIKVGTVTISTASLTLSNTGAFRIGTESGGTTKELTGQVSHARLFNYLISEIDAKSYSQGGAIDYSDIGPTQTTQTSGTLTAGKRYRLDDFIAGDDFSNIGATNVDGNEFIATGTTPTTWTNLSVIRPIGALCDYRPSSIISATWFDLSGNDLDLTVTNAIAVGVSETIITAEEFVFTGGTGDNRISIPDNLADALSVEEGLNKYVTHVTTDDSEAVVFNEGGLDHDFRVEGLNDESALFVEGSSDSVIVGGGSSPTLKRSVSDMEVQGDQGQFAVWRDNSGDAGAATIDFLREQSSGIVTDDAVLGYLIWRGNDGVDNTTIGVRILAEVNGTPAANRIPTDLVISVSAGVSDNDIAETWRFLKTGPLQANGAQSITTGGNNALTLDVGTSDVIIPNIGILYINDTVNANMTTGITINQAGADNEIFTVKSSDVSHPFTGITEDDTYFNIKKWSSNDGGAQLRGYTDGDNVAISLHGYIGNASPTLGAIVLRAHKTDGGIGKTALADGEILLDVQNDTTSKLQVLGDGSISFAGAVTIDSSGNNLIIIDAGSAGVRLDGTVGIGSNPIAARTLMIDKSIVGAAGQLLTHISAQGNIAEANTGTHADISGIRINNFTVTDGGGDEVVAIVAGLYIKASPIIGTTPTNGPYQIFCDGTEASRFDGDVLLGMGTATAQAEAMGKANVNTTKVGNVGTGEDDLITYSLPANSLSANGKGVRIKAWGTTAANGNTKTIKLYFGATVVRQIGPSAVNNKDWKIDAIVFRTGASTQDALGTEIVDSIALNTHSEPGEDTTTATTIKVTGEATSDNDIVCEGMFTEYIG